ncbi:MAG: lipid-A-disaccharide synthase [Candidatus Aegiribacteria sp.]|nr:lipid-A-disaccharide synthase [Candidatus Aegiribacteria sp.]
MNLVISAGDPSGDIRAGELFRKLSALVPVEASGLGGSNLSDAGVDVLFNLEDYSVMGFAEVISSLNRFRNLRNEMKSLIISENPDAVLLVDYPGFNIPLAQWAKKKGFKVIYYISPQLWAWGKGRVKKIRNSVDLMITLFEFEVEFYNQHGVRAVCAGHPLVDAIPEPSNSKPEGDLALLPGSREQEVAGLLDPMLDAYSILRSRGIVRKASVAMTESVPSRLYDRAFNTEGVTPVNSIRASLQNASAAVVCSGTATLETALWGIPFIITYRTSRLTYLLAKVLVRGVDRIGMANIVSGKDVAPELIQNNVTAFNIAERIIPLLSETGTRKKSLSDIKYVRKALGDNGAAERAARLLYNEIKHENP